VEGIFYIPGTLIEKREREKPVWRREFLRTNFPVLFSIYTFTEIHGEV
jgi:hypothetical protein